MILLKIKEEANNLIFIFQIYIESLNETFENINKEFRLNSTYYNGLKFTVAGGNIDIQTAIKTAIFELYIAIE